MAPSTPPRDVERDGRRALILALAVAFGVRILGGLLVWLAGFRAVSDDDYARVVLAQKFAMAPTLDPTGTSWLPLPFWLLGFAMRAVGTSLEAARVVSLLAAAGSAALVTWIAVRIGLRNSRAAIAAIVTGLMPWSLQLSVATVPEAPAAACAAIGLMTLGVQHAGLRMLGGLALWASCWSRYDAWPSSIVFAAFCAYDAVRASAAARTSPGRSPSGVTSAGASTAPSGWRYAIAALLAVLGPALWTLWQHLTFGQAFRYLQLVRSYRRALGPGPSLLQRILGYPSGAFSEMREVLVLAALAWGTWRLLARRAKTAADGARDDLGTSRWGRVDVDWRRALLVSSVQFVALILGDVRDGAPTHHPERALLGIAFVVVHAGVDVFLAALEQLASHRAEPRATMRRWTCAGLLVLVAWVTLRLHHTIDWYAWAVRGREVAAGRALRRAIPESTPVLVDTRDLPGGAIDYGYFALLAAFGRPAEVDRDQDPRRPRTTSSFATVEALRERCRPLDCGALLTWGEEHAKVALALGAEPLVIERSDAAGSGPRWTVFRMPRAMPAAP